jgi:hypothetical protein
MAARLNRVVHCACQHLEQQLQSVLGAFAKKDDDKLRKLMAICHNKVQEGDRQVAPFGLFFFNSHFRLFFTSTGGILVQS